MKLYFKLSTLAMTLLSCLSIQAIAAYENTKAWWKDYGEQEEVIHANMQRYGINRDNMAALRRLKETAPPYSFPHVKVGVDDLYNPGEHYRIEMDEFILTVKVPDAKKIPGQWIWPYTNTRTPEPGMAKLLQNNKGYVDVVKLGWFTCRSIFPGGLVGNCEMMSFGVLYGTLNAEKAEAFSTPEKFREISARTMKNMIPTQSEINKVKPENRWLSRAGNRIVLPAETVVINGRVWIRDAMNTSYGLGEQTFYYKTILSPDRSLGISFSLPQYDYNANPDPSTYPAAIKRAIAIMEEMAASLRVVNTKDDGSPDPFVIERVEPAPLPVREKPPAAE